MDNSHNSVWLKDIDVIIRKYSLKVSKLDIIGSKWGTWSTWWNTRMSQRQLQCKRVIDQRIVVFIDYIENSLRRSPRNIYYSNISYLPVHTSDSKCRFRLHQRRTRQRRRIPCNPLKKFAIRTSNNGRKQWIRSTTSTHFAYDYFKWGMKRKIASRRPFLQMFITRCAVDFFLQQLFLI